MLVIQLQNVASFLSKFYANLYNKQWKAVFTNDVTEIQKEWKEIWIDTFHVYIENQLLQYIENEIIGWG